MIYYYTSVDSKEVISVIIKSPSLAYKVIKMNDRKPYYKLATFSGRKPYADGDRAQARVVEHLQLFKNCHEDPSLIVVDVGAYLGEFCKYCFQQRVIILSKSRILIFFLSL